MPFTRQPAATPLWRRVVSPGTVLMIDERKLTVSMKQEIAMIGMGQLQNWSPSICDVPRAAIASSCRSYADPFTHHLPQLHCSPRIVLMIDRRKLTVSTKRETAIVTRKQLQHLPPSMHGVCGAPVASPPVEATHALHLTICRSCGVTAALELY